MRKYRLWLDTFKKVYNYEMKFLELPKGLQETATMQYRYKQSESLKFKVAGKIRDVFTLPEIDSLLAGYQNEEQFLEALSRQGETYQKKHASHNLIATYKKQAELVALDLVYDSPLLQKYAFLERKRTEGTSKKLKGSEELNVFCTQLLNLVANKGTRDYVLDPEKLSKDIDLKDRAKLSNYMPKSRKFVARDIRKCGVMYTNPLYQALSEYAKSVDVKKSKEAQALPTLQEEEQLIICQKQVLKSLCKDYTTLRSAVLFMKTYQNIKEKQKMEVQEEVWDGQLELNFDTPVPGASNPIDEYSDEYSRIQEENADILEQYALEKAQERNKRFGIGPNGEIDVTQEEVVYDGYAFEEIDREMDDAPPVKGYKHG